MSPWQPVRIGMGAIVALLSGMASWLLLQLIRALGGSFPAISWIGLVPLLAVTVLVLVMAWPIRRYLTGATRVRPTAERARGTLVGAQAAALGGAALVGWYLANAAVHLPTVDVPSHRVQLIWGLVHAVAAGLVSAAGYVGQSWCRIPLGEDDDRGTATEGDGDLAYG
ncbi:DUF3180 domain-containing protein [Ornithinimicrobium sp. Y1694]|uniref:DUF3180 domain-containing protein n=1 Tax=Ornithinimicrobium sp. Y1694 TaxID=3418590 RepID=UPI003CED0E31